MEIALKCGVKQNKNGKLASPINFETQIFLLTETPKKISPSKSVFEKYKPRALFSEFYGILFFQSAFQFCFLPTKPCLFRPTSFHTVENPNLSVCRLNSSPIYQSFSSVLRPEVSFIIILTRSVLPCRCFFFS